MAARHAFSGEDQLQDGDNSAGEELGSIPGHSGRLLREDQAAAAVIQQRLDRGRCWWSGRPVASDGKL